MTNDFSDQMNRAEAFFDAVREMSEMLNGGVRTLMTEGWSEQQAREMIVAAFVNSARGVN